MKLEKYSTSKDIIYLPRNAKFPSNLIRTIEHMPETLYKI